MIKIYLIESLFTLFIMKSVDVEVCGWIIFSNNKDIFWKNLVTEFMHYDLDCIEVVISFCS